jgi:hypothetical protein
MMAHQNKADRQAMTVATPKVIYEVPPWWGFECGVAHFLLFVTWAVLIIGRLAKRRARSKFLPKRIQRPPAIPFGGDHADPGSRHHWNN